MSSRSKRSRAESLSPALFPFLAVLVCTMGALVLILVIVVSQASASAKLTVQADEDALLETSDMVEVASEEMKAQRAKQQDAIDNRRSQLAGIEDHISRLIDEFKVLEHTARAIQLQSTHTDEQRIDQSQRMIAIKEQIGDEQVKLDEARSKFEKSMPAFAILPYQGNRGTTRRPIYLECTQGGVIIQPEGVVISIEDLKPPHGPGNPLDASLRMIRSAFQRLAPTASSTVSPYPLLLVRPDGIKAYVLARAAMNGWDDQFGYELIDQKMPLAFPPTIPGLSSQLVDNLGIARQRQIALIAAMPRRYGSENEWDEALDSIDQGISGETANSSSNPRRAAGNDWSTIDSEIAQSPNPSPWKMIAELPNSPGRGNASASGSPLQNSPPVGYGNSSALPSQTLSPTPSSQDIQRMRQASQQGSLEPSGTLTTNQSGQPNDGWQDPAVGEGASSDANDLNHPLGMGAAPAPGGNPANASSGTSQFPGMTSMNSMQVSGAQAMGTQGNSMSFSTPTNPDGSQTTQADGPASERNSVDASPAIDLSPRSSNQRSSNNPKSASSSPVRTWTTSHRNTNGTSVSRPVTIVAMSDRWLIMRDHAPLQVEHVIPLSLGPSQAGNQLEKAVSERVESWGVAVAGGHWQPKLNIQYGPNSEISVQRLRKILDGSGLEMELQSLR